MIAEKTTLQRNKSYYKTKLEESKLRYSSELGKFNPYLREKIDKYYSSFLGEHSYLDTHSGRTVKARTYHKRLGFANTHLQDIESDLVIEKMSGKVREEDLSSLRNYMQDIYNISIRDNSYLKNKTIKNRINAKRIRKKLNSLESRFLEPAPMSMIKTNEEIYSHYSDIPSNDVSPIDQVKLPKTSSPLLNRLNSIQEARESFASINDPKITNHGETNWPIPARYAKPSIFPSWLNFKNIIITMATGFAIMGLYKGISNWNKNEKLYESIEARHSAEQNLSSSTNISTLSSQQSSVESKISYISPISIIQVPKLIEKVPSEYIPKLYSPSESNQSAIELAKQRVREAKQKIEEEKAKSASNSSNVNIDQAQKSKTSSIYSDIKFDWKKSILSKWEERARKRSLESKIVKTVTYYPNGKIIINYPTLSSDSEKLVAYR